MDKQRKKKIRSARIIATNIFMGIAVVAIVAVLMLIAMGFSFNEKGKLEQSGLLQVTSQPSRATVEIDGNQLLSLTEVNKMINSGEHDIKVSKSGFDTWQKHINLSAGLLTRIEWVRLFPINQEITTTDSFRPLRLISYSNDNKHLLTAETDNTNIHYISLQGSETSHKKLSLTQALQVTPEQARQGAFAVESWNSNNNKVVMRWLHEDRTDWYLFDLNDAAKTINLTSKFNLAFNQVYALSGSDSKLWALEGDKLYLLDLNDAKNPTTVIARGVEAFAQNGNTVAYLAKAITSPANDDASTTETPDAETTADDAVESSPRAIYTYKDGEDGAVQFLELKDDDHIVFTMGTYWGDEWLAYALNDNIYVVSGKYPSYQKTDSPTLKRVITHEKLGYTPSSVSVNGSSRIAAFWSGKDVATVDLETEDYFDLELDTSTTVKWLDNYLLWESTGDKIIVRDFDGNNRREIINHAQKADHVVITNNNEWLYFFEQNEQTAPDATDEATTDEAASAPTYVYSLKRLKLTI